MLEVKNLIKNYGDFKVLKGISFQVQRGKIHGFLGKNGAGKTTTMNILAGLTAYNSGEIFYKDLDFKKNKNNILNSLGYCPQAPTFFGYMTANEYLNYLFDISNYSVANKKNSIDEILELVRLKEHKDRKLKTYSGGMKQRFGIAAALFNNPEFIILDEPTASLDPEGRALVIRIIEDLKQKGITVFLSTHILNDAERICDDVTIIEKGSIVASKPLKELQGEYVKPIIDVSFNKDPGAVYDGLKNNPGVLKMSKNNDSITIYLKDISYGGRELLKFLLNYDINIKAYNIRQYTLEDIFMDLMGEEERS